MKIAGFDTSASPLLIAEIGNNHEGDPALAIELADAAMEAGADAVKIQVINPVRLVNRSQAERIAQLTRYRLSIDVFTEMSERVRAKGRLFMASAFDVDSLTSILPVIDAVKIASGDLNFALLLGRAASSGKPVILSSGMSTLEEIRQAVATIAANLPAERTVQDSLGILHCVSLYPTPLDNANLSAIHTLRSALGLTTGYSDHTLGNEASVAALALGARIIEKHFTLDKKRTSFRDHALSADPDDMRRLAELVHGFDAMLGTGARTLEMADAETRAAARRSLVAARDLPAGSVLGESDIEYVRPGTGLAPTETARVIGRRIRAAMRQHDQFQETNLDQDV
jgi:N,N'-diacetyllegionaminate synthase